MGGWERWKGRRAEEQNVLRLLSLSLPTLLFCSPWSSSLATSLCLLSPSPVLSPSAATISNWLLVGTETEREKKKKI